MSFRSKEWTERNVTSKGLKPSQRFDFGVLCFSYVITLLLLALFGYTRTSSPLAVRVLPGVAYAIGMGLPLAILGRDLSRHEWRSSLSMRKMRWGTALCITAAALALVH